MLSIMDDDEYGQFDIKEARKLILSALTDARAEALAEKNAGLPGYTVRGDSQGTAPVDDPELTEDFKYIYGDWVKLRHLLRRIAGWDHMDTAADGAYWRSEIAKAVGEAQSEASWHGMQSQVNEKEPTSDAREEGRRTSSEYLHTEECWASDAVMCLESCRDANSKRREEGKRAQTEGLPGTAASGESVNKSTPQDGVRFDAETGSWVARYTILTAGRSEVEARDALASSVRLAALTWPARTLWKPIHTAPRGAMVLFCSMSPTIQARDWCWVDWISDRGMMLRPNGLATHWMPLPAPPTDVASGSGVTPGHTTTANEKTAVEGTREAGAVRRETPQT